MGKGPEALVVDAIKREVLAQFPGALIEKNHGSPFQGAGRPDLYVFIEGRVFALEVKAQKPSESRDRARRRCTPVQRATIYRLRLAGVPSDCVLSPAEAIAVIRGSAQFMSEDDLKAR